MKVRDFIFWLHGSFEINGANSLDRSQLTMIRRHLARVKPQFGDDSKSIDFINYLNIVLDQALRDLAPAEKMSSQQCQMISDRLDALFIQEVPTGDTFSSGWSINDQDWKEFATPSSFQYAIPPIRPNFFQRILYHFFPKADPLYNWHGEALC